MYMRLDKNIEDLLKKLDQEVGVGAYTVFLTADHAVAENPQYLTDNKIPGGFFGEGYARTSLNEYLGRFFPAKDFIEAVRNNQLYLNQEAFQGTPKTTGLDMFIVAELAGKFLMTLDGVANYYTEAVLRQGNYDEGGIKGMVIRGYNAKRSGDVVFIFEPGWLESPTVQGTTHGSPYSYDTHIPILFFGYGVKRGSSVEYHPITDVAPTVSILLKTKFPSGCTGNPVKELLKE
jgi:arylsulfatase A-like enzyme